MKIKQTDFSTGNVCRNILEVGIPLTFAQLLNLLYNVVDRIYIGRIPGAGKLALTGVGICFPIIALISAFTQLFGNGGAPLFSMERGKGNTSEAEKIMGTSFSMLVLCGILITLLGYIFYKPVLYAFGASGLTFPYASEYFGIYLSGTVFVMISVGMNPYINSQGFGNMGMLTVLIGAVLNIVLDPLFIFVLKLGVKGAAIATVISQAVSCLWVLSFLTGKRAALKIKRQYIGVEFSRALRIVAMGVPSFVINFTNSLVQVTCNTTLQTFGGDLYVGIMTVLTSVREIVSMPFMGISQGAIPVMSYNYGEKAYGKVKTAIKFITVFCVVYTTIAWAVLAIFPEAFIRIFNKDTELILMGAKSLKIYFFGFFFMAFQLAGQNTFLALGKAKHATFFSLFRKAIIVVPLTLILPHLWNLGVDGVFWAEPVSNVLGGLTCFIVMLITVKKELKNETV